MRTDAGSPEPLATRPDGCSWAGGPAVDASALRTRRPVVLACDAAYAMQLASTLRSLAEANRSAWPLDLHVLSQGYSEEMRRRVLDSLPVGSASIRWIPVDVESFGGFSTPEWISTMTYARYLIPRVFGDDVSRVLYLDADILVLDDLGSLWETDLDGAVLGAVRDRVAPQLEAGSPEVEDLPRVRDYFNAGVLLIDLQRWRSEHISERGLQYHLQHPRSPYCDQDGLNAACDGLWKRLDPRWNFQEHYETDLSALDRGQRPGIVHFVSGFKPWKPSSLNVNASFYDGFRRRTRYARTLRERLSDTLVEAWHRSRRRLRRHALPRAIWRGLKRLTRGIRPASA